MSFIDDLLNNPLLLSGSIPVTSKRRGQLCSDTYAYKSQCSLNFDLTGQKELLKVPSRGCCREFWAK